MQPDERPQTVKNEDEHGSAAGHDELSRARNELGDQLLEAEDLAALKAGKMPGSPQMREQAAAKGLGSDKDALRNNLYKQSAQNRQRGGPRGIFIGLGAGGGIMSVVAGFAFMLPFKLPGIMNTLVDDAGKRLEKVVERRAEQVFLQFILRGTSAAGLNGNLILTGNPIGDLFANMRTANFEADLKEQFGLEFKPGPNRTVTLVHDGTDLGSADSPEAILKILGEGKSLSRSDVRKILRSTQTWGFYKRAKFVKWLALKYNIPRWGARDIEPGESEEDYNKSVLEEHITNVEAVHIANGEDFVNCVASSGDCPKDKTGGTKELMEQSKKSIAETAKQVATQGAQKAITSVMEVVMPKIVIALATSSAIVGVGQIDAIVRVIHFLREEADNNVMQNKLAEYKGSASAVLGANIAGFAHQNMAGELPPSTAGMFADRFDGWETSKSYNAINSGKAIGQDLEPMEKVNETVPLPELANIAKGIFGGTTGAVLFATADAWFATVSRAIDLAGEITGSITAWIIANTPARHLMGKISPFIAEILKNFFKFLGMFIDPLAIGPKLAMYVHQGFLWAYNQMSKELGMRLLNRAQAREMDNEIRQDRLADLAGQPFHERLFNLQNPHSLATKLATTFPGSSNPVLALTSGSVRMVAQAPQAIAGLTAGKAYAAEEGVVVSEELFNMKAYGGTNADLSAPLDASVFSPGTPNCPENRDDRFNHCKVDNSVVESMSCPHVKCKDMEVGGEFAPYGQPFSYFVKPLPNIGKNLYRVFNTAGETL